MTENKTTSCGANDSDICAAYWDQLKDMHGESWNPYQWMGLMISLAANKCFDEEEVKKLKVIPWEVEEFTMTRIDQNEEVWASAMVIAPDYQDAWVHHTRVENIDRENHTWRWKAVNARQMVKINTEEWVQAFQIQGVEGYHDGDYFGETEHSGHSMRCSGNVLNIDPKKNWFYLQDMGGAGWRLIRGSAAVYEETGNWMFYPHGAVDVDHSMYYDGLGPNTLCIEEGDPVKWTFLKSKS
ncbi:hypothetical protein [Streptomyces sp. NPDC090132]|uniref:hypothetical protein n=1 Tax=Streptomyces sp. NPDC090132 TaxID=3365955 RepID=UPI00381732C4